MQQFLQQWLTQILYSIPNVLTALLIFLASLYLARLVAAATSTNKAAGSGVSSTDSQQSD